MIPDYYPVIDIKPEWVRNQEDMGSKKKFWYFGPDEEGGYWLFKYPKANTGEHWAEKIAAKIAGLLDIKCARVELAEFRGEQGSASETFTGVDWELVHGNQMLAMSVHNYDPDATFRHSKHTLENIWKVMESVFVENTAMMEAKCRIAEYIILDALIGNTDRHHENWGVLRRWSGEYWEGFMAPSFDHASSLGRELLDVRREMLLSENRVGEYAEKGRGAVYWSEDDRHGLSPLELVRRSAISYPDIFHTSGKNLKIVDEKAMEDIVYRIPNNWMSTSARKFAITLLCYNLGCLRQLFQ